MALSFLHSKRIGLLAHLVRVPDCRSGGDRFDPGIDRAEDGMVVTASGGRLQQGYVCTQINDTKANHMTVWNRQTNWTNIRSGS